MSGNDSASLQGRRVLVVGGSSGIGLGAAKAAKALGASLTICSRSAEKIEAARRQLGEATQGLILDVADDTAVEAFFADKPAFDHVVVSAAQVRMGAIRDLSVDQASAVMNSKFWGAYRVARAARINDGGSLTLVSGFLALRPRKGAALVGAVNAALEGLTRGLALELAPVRVNAVSPGLVATPAYAGMPDDARNAMYAAAAERLPAGRVGESEHIALQIMACVLNPYMTGSIVYVDGGGLLV
jgi:NAD(P)-dependent dehydrogenase (short-subunit alcohol dehydrogenase family)